MRLVWYQVEFFPYHSLVKMWREPERKSSQWFWVRVINNQEISEVTRGPSSPLLLNITLAQMNGFRVVGKGLRRLAVPPNGDKFPTVHPCRRPESSLKEQHPHPQQRTHKPSLSWDQGAQPACRAEISHSSHLTVYMSEECAAKSF